MTVSGDSVLFRYGDDDGIYLVEMLYMRVITRIVITKSVIAEILSLNSKILQIRMQVNFNFITTTTNKIKLRI